jgi:hypothetical protein
MVFNQKKKKKKRYGLPRGPPLIKDAYIYAPPLAQGKFEMLHQRIEFPLPLAQRAKDRDKECVWQLVYDDVV